MLENWSCLPKRNTKIYQHLFQFFSPNPLLSKIIEMNKGDGHTFQIEAIS